MIVSFERLKLLLSDVEGSYRCAMIFAFDLDVNLVRI